MSAERYMVDDAGTVIDKVTRDNYELASELVNLLNYYASTLEKLVDENEELKDIINEFFNMITELDWAKKEYCNALIRILGEENDVDKAKQRIKEFLE